MQTGKLYFIKDEFYERFKNCGLLENKEIINGKQHSRPCCYLFKYEKLNDDIFWMVPISSKVDKYIKIYNKSIEKYNMCDNISFCYILGEKEQYYHRIYFL